MSKEELCARYEMALGEVMSKWPIYIGAWLPIPIAYAIWGSCEVNIGFAVGASYMAFIGEVK